MDKNRQSKKEEFSAPEKKGSQIKVLLAVVVLVAVGLIGGYVLTLQGMDSIPTVNSVDGEIRLDLKQVSDGQAHYFRYATDQGLVTFFVIKSVDGVMRAAFDACDVCYREKKGYRQEGSQMVCNNCDMKFRSDLINVVKGGCNPAPLSRRIEAGQLVINQQDVLRGAWYFGS